MKTCHNLFVGVGFFILCCTMFTACVNHISEEEGEIINNGDIPLKFVADIHEIMNTRVVNNSFGEKDEVGLFALAGTTTMQEERYADNLHFVRSSTGEFVSDESVYYPDDGVTLNLISYYPYQKGGVAMGESSMQVTVATTQDKLDDYSHSDFLVASKKEVLASKDAVALTYNHQFFRMKIVLVPGEEENIEEILSVKPTLSVSGFYTKTIYDFQKKTFSAYSEEKDITPAGEWEIKDGRLVGKELILIPQEATVGYQYHEIMNTRVVNNSFGEKDEVGLFALAGTTTMQEERYADNLHFVRSSTGEFVSDESVYYPDDGVTLNLISYYPYQKGGVAMGESSMQVTVATTQDKLDDYSHSDFLVASKKEVLASKDAVALTYNHQFFRMKIVLVPGEEENIEEILSVKPTLSVSGFYTKTIYDFQKKTFSAYSEEKDITPAGEWEIKDGRLVGKELILIPQEATVGYQYITLEAAGKLYTSLLPSTLQLESGKQRELEITFVSAEDILMSKVNGEIGDWDGTEVDHTESGILHKYIDVSKLTFEKSNVYKVIHSGKQVAEICKEYLVTPDFSSQAIVAYPMKEDGSVNLSQGIVAQLLGKSGKVNGGSVSWNMEDHSLTYVDGTLLARHNVYVLADGTISLSVTLADDVLPVLAQEDIVRDVRGGVIHNYPLVKIGTQYWMRSNLETSLYVNDDALPKLNQVTANIAGYLQSTTEHYFYTANVALSGRILPTHWSIPNWEDWNILKDYLKGEASLLKSGIWLSLKTEEQVQPATNLSGFNGIPVGMYVGAFQADYENKHLAYWTLDNTNATIDTKVFYMKSDTNIIEESNAGIDTKAFAIRCIRK